MRAISFEDDLSQQIDRAKPSMLFEGNTPRDLQTWQEEFRGVLTGLLGNKPHRGALDLTFTHEEDRGAHIRYRVQYQSESDVYVPAYLLVPKGLSAQKNAPGILCLHGHGRFGKDSVAGVDDTGDRRAEIARYQYNNLGPKFVEKGYVVLAPDLRGFGQRRPGYPGLHVDYCARNYLCATLLGTTVVALHLCDLQAALDVLGSLEYVDSDMLACAGLSLGGRITMMLSAMDNRVKAAVPSGCMSLFQERYQALHLCGAQLIPGLLQYGDTPEIFSLIAPRPMVLEMGFRDPLIPHRWAERGLARIRKAYEAAGAQDNLFVDWYDGEHIFHGTVSGDVLDRWRADEL